MAVTSNDIANEALQIVGDDQPYVTGQNPTWDQSTPGKVLAKIYGPVVATVQRQWGWDASRSIVALALSGNAAPGEWSFEYIYPSNGIEVWQVRPQKPSDPNNPLPIDWSVGNSQVNNVQTKVIWTNLETAFATYNNNVSENSWDALFREAVVRLLASELAMALGGRPDLGQSLLESGAAFESLGEARPD